MRTTISVRLAVLAGLMLVGGAWAYRAESSAGEEMADAGLKFLESLSAEQRAKTLLPYDSPKRVGWHFVPLAERKGLQIKEMNEAQRKAAHTLLRAALSQAGYDKAAAIMSLESILHELEKARRGGAIRDAQRYYFTLFGEPGESGKWGLSVEGHHLSLNFVVEDAKVIGSTPSFFGANPATLMADYGPQKKGTRVLAAEEELAFELVRSLDADQLKTALVAEKAPSDIRAPATPLPPKDEGVGLEVGKMKNEQIATVKKLVEAYLGHVPGEVAAARKKKIDTAGPEKIRFAWAGATKPGIGHYYRLQGPTFLIEFVNTQPDSAGNPANHIHSVWRDMEGDFGIPIEKGK
jgi:hypothetical protein